MCNWVWIMDLRIGAREVPPLDADIVVDDNNRAIEGLRRQEAGEPLFGDWFPKEMWGDESSGTLSDLPDLFYGNGYWVLSSRCAAVFQRFDLGQGALYPVRLLQKDRKTMIAGEYFSLIFGNVKKAFRPEESTNPRKSTVGNELWTLPFLHKDNAMAVSAAALEGPDIWVDPALMWVLFMSDRLAKALKEAGVSRPFALKKCRVI